MSTKTQPRTVTVTLDGREVQATFREPILTLTRRYGIHIPTLCHHDALEPEAACRLCLVEVTKGQRTKVVTACNFPVEEGVEIRTSTPLVLQSRQMTVESLLARCPEVPEIQRLAKQHAVESTRFTAEEDTCILCTLCTRACETYVTSAIATIERGTKKFIGTFGGEPPVECVGCGACAEICPTGHIKVQRDGTRYRIWEREFELSVCQVEPDLCRACGACEAACPWSIPRVVLRKGQQAAAWIDPEICKACGVCLPACPSGAITQPGDERHVPASAEAGVTALVIACGRSNLKGPLTPPLPEGAEVLELSCAGAVSHAMLLGALARGYAGVLVLGRHEQTCRLDGAEGQGRRIVDQVDQLAQLAGLGAGRLAFREPPAGRLGPAAEVGRFVQSLRATPLKGRLADELQVDTLDGGLEILRWLSQQPEIQTDGSAWLDAHGLPAARPGQPALLAAAIPYFDLALREWIGPDAMAPVLRQALDVLSALGIEAGVAVGGFRAGEPRLLESLGDSHFYTLCGGCGDRVQAAGGRITPMARLLAERGRELAVPAFSFPVAAAPEQAQEFGLTGLGARLAAIPACDGLPIQLSLDADQRRAIDRRFDLAAEAGAAALLVDGPAQLVQFAIARRDGAWRRHHVQPLLATTIAAAGLATREEMA